MFIKIPPVPVDILLFCARVNSANPRRALTKDKGIKTFPTGAVKAAHLTAIAVWSWKCHFTVPYELVFVNHHCGGYANRTRRQLLWCLGLIVLASDASQSSGLYPIIKTWPSETLKMLCWLPRSANWRWRGPKQKQRVLTKAQKESGEKERSGALSTVRAFIKAVNVCGWMELDLRFIANERESSVVQQNVSGGGSRPRHVV